MTLKHCENDPNSMKFPFKIPEGIFAHASNTEMKQRKYSTWIRSSIKNKENIAKEVNCVINYIERPMVRIFSFHY